jgi:RNA polymerase sigma-70 factor (ECF subfamily)
MDDLEFVQRCVKGDKISWDEFLDKYSRLIYTYIHSVIEIKGLPLTQSNKEDIFQELIFSLIKNNCKKLKSFRALNGCSLASWLRQVSINFTIDCLRKINPPEIPLDEKTQEGLGLKEIIIDKAQMPRDKAINREKLVFLADCIKQLDTEDKYFLELNLNVGLSLEGLKDHFKVSRGAIDMRRSRIIQRLRDCFRKKGFVLSV